MHLAFNTKIDVKLRSHILSLFDFWFQTIVLGYELKTDMQGQVNDTLRFPNVITIAKVFT